MKPSFVDRDATVPRSLDTPRWTAVPLTPAHNAADLEAYLGSPDVIRTHSHGRWHLDEYTLADNQVAAAQHEAEHQARQSFAFILLDAARRQSFGCFYLLSLRSYWQRYGVEAQLLDRVPSTAAMATFWVRQDLLGTGFSYDLIAALEPWLAQWPFGVHVYRIAPGEQDSQAALEANGMQALLATIPSALPYRWFASPATIMRLTTS